MKDFATKYRPQTLEEVVGQGALTKAMIHQVNQGNIVHSYLFCGPRGTGKTTTARAFSKAINADVIELDGASNNGVEQVRDLINDVMFRPTDGRKYKVYIIDECHMLTNSAFNALLKTLEEPPSHVIFVLCTTDPQKLPVTISSRCERYNLVAISVDDIVERLRYISSEEQLNIEEDALMYIAKSVDGGMRDAVKLLQKCSSLDETITVATVIEALGNVDKGTIKSLLEFVINKDRINVKNTLTTLLNGGIDSKVLVANLIEFALEKIEVLMTEENPSSPIVEILMETANALVNLADELKYSTQPKQVLTIRLLMLSSTTYQNNMAYEVGALNGKLPEEAVKVLSNLLCSQENKILSSWARR